MKATKERTKIVRDKQQSKKHIKKLRDKRYTKVDEKNMNNLLLEVKNILK